MTIIEQLKEYSEQLKYEIQFVKERICYIERQKSALTSDYSYWSERLEHLQIDLEDVKTSLSVEEEEQKISKEIKS